MHRRHFLKSAAALAAAALLPARNLLAQPRPPRILLRSSWQVVNIGDIAHTPGVLALLERYIPDAQVTLWASGDLSEEVAQMEHNRFADLNIVKGSIAPDGKANNDALAQAVATTDFLLHGSGPSFVAQKDVAAFVKATGKPFGVYGITYGSTNTDRDLLSQAKFAYFRDTPSLERAKADGVHAPVMEFAPDGAFACDLRNDDAASAFLKANALEPGKFVCCIPRWRNTPYWEIKDRKVADLEKKKARNQEMVEHDIAPLRDAVIAVARQTPMKILLCPEDKTQMALGKAMIYDKLPDDVKPKVVWRETFWLTDEALSTYVKSAGVFGLEMHSPIMCIGNGVPAIVCRFAEQTTKGFMWRDIGLSDWLLDFDVDADLPKLTPAVLDMVKDPQAAKAKVAKAREFVERRQKETMALVAKSLRP